MKTERLLKMLFVTSLAVVSSACEPSKSPADKMVEEQNQRIYVKNLEDRIIQLVDMMSGAESGDLDLEALEVELAENNSEATNDKDVNGELESQAFQEAMLVELRAELDSLLTMYQEALNNCEECEDSTEVSDLEHQVQDAEDNLASVISSDSSQPEEGEKTKPDSQDLLSPEEVTVVLAIRDLTTRTETLNREKEELFEALNRTVLAEEHIKIHVSEKSQAIDDELAIIAAERQILRDELVRLRLERHEQAE